ncbi:MAG: ABC transporter permease [Eubacteriaceae bacterium]|nr:ABC transporter permease [Eubacteriaceae bacterium]
MNKVTRPILSIAIFLILWQVLSIAVNRSIFPSPIAVFANTFAIFEDKLFIHSLYSIRRILAGIFAAAAIGWPLGILTGHNLKIDRYLSPVIYFLYPVPKIAFLPVFMLLFGLGEFTKIVMIFIIVFFQITVTIRDSIRLLDKSVFYPLTVLGASKTDVFRYILIPYSFPRLLSSIRIALGTAIAVLFFSETFGTEYGLGYFIMDSMLRINYLEMYSGIVALSVTGLLFFVLIDILQNKMVKWQTF